MRKTTTSARTKRRRWPWIVVAAVVAVAGLVGPRVYNAFALLDSGEQINVGGRNIFVRCEGSGSPTVILEHGLGANGTEWEDVQSAVATDTRVCYTSRAGMGFSDPAGEGETRTAKDAVVDLAAALDGANIKPPYVMVGHSFGGFVVRLFADEHPDDVVGMVLVDSSHHNQATVLESSLSPQSWQEIGNLYGSANPERMDFAASGTQAAGTQDLGAMPLAVLEAELQATNADGSGISQTTIDELEDVMETLWPELQADLATLSSASTHTVVRGSSHFIQLDNPEAVTEAIRSILAQS